MSDNKDPSPPFGFPLEGIPLAGNLTLGPKVSVTGELTGASRIKAISADIGTTVALVNENKVLEEKILRQIDRHVTFGAELDQRAVALARTKIQEAFMWLNRGVFQPQRLEGDLD